MRCDCGDELKKRVFPARIDFAVYYDADRKTASTNWTQDELIVCLGCGEISALVPGRVLMDLKAGGGESAA